jgi:hypothetical protein
MVKIDDEVLAERIINSLIILTKDKFQYILAKNNCLQKSKFLEQLRILQN